MSKAILVMALALVSAQLISAGKPSKPDQRDGRQEEAYNACAATIRDRAKRPDALSLDVKYTFYKSAGLLGDRNEINISIEGSGMNDYGAVLKHTFLCSEKCKAGKPCFTTSLLDNGN